MSPTTKYPPPDRETVERAREDAREGRGSTIDEILNAEADVTYEAAPTNQAAILERLEHGADVAPDELETLATIAAKATSLVGAADEAAKERIETLEAQLAKAEKRADHWGRQCQRVSKARCDKIAAYNALAKRVWRYGWICWPAGILIGWASVGAIWYFCG